METIQHGIDNPALEIEDGEKGVGGWSEMDRVDGGNENNNNSDSKMEIIDSK